MSKNATGSLRKRKGWEGVKWNKDTIKIGA